MSSWHMCRQTETVGSSSWGQMNITLTVASASLVHGSACSLIPMKWERRKMRRTEHVPFLSILPNWQQAPKLWTFPGNTHNMSVFLEEDTMRGCLSHWMSTVHTQAGKKNLHTKVHECKPQRSRQFPLFQGEQAEWGAVVHGKVGTRRY